MLKDILTLRKVRGEVLNYIDWLKDIPLIDMDFETLLGRILIGNYICEVGFVEEEPKLILVYYIKGKLCFIVGLWARDFLHKNNYVEEWYGDLKADGIKEVRCASNIPVPNYEDIVKMKKHFTVYRRML